MLLNLTTRRAAVGETGVVVVQSALTVIIDSGVVGGAARPGCHHLLCFFLLRPKTH